jgi:Cu+-exporting ATPase
MAIDPVCHMEVNEKEAAGKVEYQGQTYYFCSASCQKQFEAEPAKYARAQLAKDPVCGMEISPAEAAGKSEYEGQTYYFCSLGCKKAFNKEPHKYVDQTHSHH